MPDLLAIKFLAALPDTAGGQMGRREARDVPLIDGVIGDAVHADLATGPRLDRSPFDAVVNIYCPTLRPRIEISRTTAAATRVDPYANIAVRDPFLGIDHFPVRILIRRALGRFGIATRHSPSGRRVALLKGQSLAESAVGQDNGISVVVTRPEDVGAQHDTVVHLDWYVPFDNHAVAFFRLVLSVRAVLFHEVVPGSFR